jgi:hypothetical protein
MARGRGAAKEPSPCFEVKVNGRRVAVAGVRGEGNLNAHVHWSRTTHYGEGPWASGGMRLRVTGGDFNDPAWDQFREWVDRPLAIGDHLEIRVVRGSAPDPGRRLPRSQRVPLDELPSRRNPTATRVRGAEVCAVTDGVFLFAGRRLQGNVLLSAAQARRLGRGMLHAADDVQRRAKARQSKRRPRK